MRKLFSVLTTAAVSLALSTSAFAAPLLIAPRPSQAAEASDAIVIYYTNDVHSYIDNAAEDPDGLTYSKAAALKNATPGALLVDAGDHLQGTAYGGMDKGATIVELMNAAGYDAATPGNHEFDYGMVGFTSAVSAANYPYLSCNLRHEQSGVPGETMLDGYTLLEAGGKQIAFLGITTPETMNSTTPAYFQDTAGNFIYGISGGADGADLYSAVQTAIDDALAAGADYVIALGHLGVDPSSRPWTSREVIANTTGLDAFIDGHSHTTIEMESVTDESGETVVLTQTGSYLDAIGRLTISSDGSISTELLSAEDLAELEPDAEVKALEEKWIADISGRLGQVIGRAEVTFDNYDADGKRLVRRQSTNTGDFAADALYYLFDTMDMPVDAAVMNGGGVRSGAVTGDLTYLTCKEIHTFGNVACLLKVKGQQLLDALEWGSRSITTDPSTESGGFLHVSGLTYTLDISRESTVQADDKNIWAGPPTGSYRVSDVKIFDRESGEYVPLDLSATYHLAGYNYNLRDLGDGFAMLSGAENVLDYVAEDYMVLANYVQGFEEQTVKADNSPLLADYPNLKLDYSSTEGSGRITVVTGSAAAPETPAITPTENVYTVCRGDTLWALSRKYGCTVRDIVAANGSLIKDPDLIYVGWQLTIPQK